MPLSLFLPVYHSPAIPVALHTLLLVGELKAGHLDDVEEGLTNSSGGGIIHLLQALPQPARHPSLRPVPSHTPNPCFQDPD